jgi:SAM-dependent methyltransferase
MTPAVGGWDNGYVTDTPYLPGYYRQQSPLHLHLACLFGGVAGLPLGPGQPLSYLELGCGQGFGAVVLAACNPDWRVTGIDFNPGHIAAARSLAAAAGIANAEFVEADLAAAADSPLFATIPEADVASLHGLWSWVADPVRDGIVRLLGNKVRPGGIVQISYNALPAWQGGLGLQRLIYESGRRVAGRSPARATAGFAVARALIEAEAWHLREPALARSLLERAAQSSAVYLAHEYMNAVWRPCFHADVVAALAEAKLEWVASAHLLENFPTLALNDEARAVVNRFDDPPMRELIKDMCLTRGLRQDVFVRGAQRLTVQERDDALAEIVLGALYAEPHFLWEIDAPAGKATLEKRFFGPAVAALAHGPRRVRDLLALPELPRHDNPAELVGVLVGSDQALPLRALASAPAASAVRLNRVAARRFVRSDDLGSGMALATTGTGAPLPCSMLDLFVAAQLLDGAAPDAAAWAERLGKGRSAEERDQLGALIARILGERAPIWRRLGALAETPSAAAEHAKA